MSITVSPDVPKQIERRRKWKEIKKDVQRNLKPTITEGKRMGMVFKTRKIKPNF